MAALGARRARRALAIGLVAVAVAGLATSWAPLPERQHAAYCAIMPDSIGLYAGNPVTQMGYQIGEVKTITPGTSDVRVDFTVTERRSLPRDVKAIIRSTSILADRSLELVGNPEPGSQLPIGGCIPLSRSSTPKSLSEVIGSTTKFINSINPAGSTNIGDVVREVDQAVHNHGAGVNDLLNTASSVVDSPDQAVSDIASIITNLAQLTLVLKDLRGPLKEIFLDAQKTTADLRLASLGAAQIVRAVLPIITLVADVERNVGDEIQFTLDAVGVTVRKLSAHAPRLANLLNPVPWWINTAANYVNRRAGLHFIRYRPPLYRIRTPDGVALCNIMNASTPGSCANVQGQPYAVDVALLQYVLTLAAKR
jgi:phospholipid/cholesterol/gamma-HCH transport system substrate-binding protein